MADRMYTLHKQAHASLPLAVHPDYMSVLTACAAHLWIKPQHLHSYVCRVEEQVAATETALAAENRAHNSSPQGA